MIGQLDSLRGYSVYPAGIVCVIGQLNSLRGYSVYPAGIICVIGQLDALKGYSVCPAGFSLCGRTAWRTEKLLSILLGTVCVRDSLAGQRAIQSLSCWVHLCEEMAQAWLSKTVHALFCWGLCVCVRVVWDARTAALYILFIFNKDESKYCPNMPITKYAPNMMSTFVVACSMERFAMLVMSEDFWKVWIAMWFFLH